MIHVSRVRMTGPLAPHQDTLWVALLASGYAPDSARNLLGVAAHLSRWLAARSLALQDLSAARIAAFLRHRRARGYTCWLGPRCLDPILSPLRAQDVVPSPEPRPEDVSPLAPLFQELETYLLEDRGLTGATVAGRLRVARRFLAALEVRDLPALGRISTAEISGFIVREARSLGVGSAKLLVTHLRSLLRFLHVRGYCRQLATAVPAVAGHRLAGLPRHIPWEEVRKLLDSCDPRTPSGLRDHAIVLLLARLALRAGEVAALELGDVHWVGGTILVRGKGSRHCWLPLPQEVGAAIARYLEAGRPHTKSRRLFLKCFAPHGDLRSGTVNCLVQRASRRAGLPGRWAHQLRHTAATQMLRGGASLQAVAEALRHRSLDTTAIYAKVDYQALRPLARPWPGGGA
jgi:site-specific recombinase XerD